ncbi:AAA family ATPase [Actinoplanes sp. NPDC026670]|uniref:AAA family ATPase n=1 Tax=Actinoplanes sp. NPDC026670 TaxID=3154700 RepID=UPI0033C109A2
MTRPTTNPPQPETRVQSVHPHRLELVEVDLVGGGRNVTFNPGLNHIVGDIATGKTTFIRLIRALLGTMPKDLPPEVNYVDAIRGHVMLGDRPWKIYRPRTTTSDALVEISEDDNEPGREALSVRLPVARSAHTYSTFLLDRLDIPAISVPQARSEPTGVQSPVTMTDWLGYCIITGDELDTEVFGHKRPYRDAKRRWVFEIAYGYFEPELARLNAQLRHLQRQLDSLEHDAEVRAHFLKDTPFADLATLEMQLAASTEELEHVLQQRRALASTITDIPGVQQARENLLAARSRRADIADRMSRLQAQIKDLSDLVRQLSSQSARLTRAIVAGEWLVDFDFVVCPRCGNDIEPARTDPHLCYLCLQHPRPAASDAELLGEQDRIASQITETNEVLEGRQNALDRLTVEASRLDRLIAELAEDLDRRTQAFVSDRAAQIEHQATRQTQLEADMQRLREYADLLQRHERQLASRETLESEQEELRLRINELELSQHDAEENVKALEKRMSEYLRQLRIPDFGQELSVKINRTTFLPEVSGRSFDELSSQGLKTLVNIAHALAHHTVAIDRNLPLPGLLILDGISANSGQEGMSFDRIRDAYRLLSRVASDEAYRGALQIIAVDNELSRDLIVEIVERVALELTREDCLIRIPDRAPEAQASDADL